MFAAVATAAPLLVLPGQAPEPWRDPARIAGCVLEGGDGDLIVLNLDDSGATLVVVHAGDSRSVRVLRPDTAAAREDTLYLAVSLLRTLRGPPAAPAPAPTPTSAAPVPPAPTPEPRAPHPSPSASAPKRATPATTQPATTPPATASTEPTPSAAAPTAEAAPTQSAAQSAPDPAPTIASPTAPPTTASFHPWLALGVGGAWRQTAGLAPGVALTVGATRGPVHLALEGAAEAPTTLVLAAPGATMTALHLAASAGWAPDLPLQPRVDLAGGAVWRSFSDDGGAVGAVWTPELLLRAGGAQRLGDVWRLGLAATARIDLGTTELRVGETGERLGAFALGAELQLFWSPR